MSIKQEDLNILTTLLQERKIKQLKDILQSENEVDIAEFIEELDGEDAIIVFRLLGKDTASDVFAELSVDMQSLIISRISDSDIKRIVEDLFVDDVVDMLEELPANVVKRVLKNATVDTRNLINQFLKYKEGSAGSIMTAEYVALKKSMTVADALKYIRTTGIDKETIYTCYVMNNHRKLEGVVTLKELIMAEPEEVVSEIMSTNIISATTDEEQEAVALTFDKYDLIALPVVDTENRLVGIITVDDVIDVLQEETTEDIEKMVAITPTDKPYMKVGIFETFKSRIPWLLFLMISAAFTGGIISTYENALSACVILTSFIPMLMGTGGNSGGQTSVTVIRSLSLGDIELKDVFKVLWKELRVAVFCGLTLGVVNFLKMLLIDRYAVVNDGLNIITVALTVSLSLLFTVIIAKLIGAILPILAKKLKLDPAVVASPFITTIVDALSLIIYFNIASFLLKL